MKKLFFAALFAAPLFVGCANTEETTTTTTEDTTIEIAGNYTDNYGGGHEITATTWTQSSTYSTSAFTFTKVDNTNNYAIAQNFDNNSFSASKYSRFDWTTDNSTLYFCQIAYNKDNATAAEAVTTADTSTPATSGCGSFAWSSLTAK